MEKLANIQKELKAPKDLYNQFGKFSYRSAESILEAVKPLLDGAILTLKDDILVFGDGENARFYVKATATFQDGDFVKQTTAFAREPLDKKGMDEPQTTGTASSYARKYALNGLFCIDDNKDADTEEYNGNQKPEANEKSSIEDVIKGMEFMTAATAKKFYAKAIELYPKGTEEYKRWVEVWIAKKDSLEAKSDEDYLNQESEYLNNI